jgi:septal ring factor EnvC (AmiA/AmiB activator)
MNAVAFRRTKAGAVMQVRVVAILLSFGLCGCDAMQRLDLLNAQLASTNAKISKTNSHLSDVKHDTSNMDQKLAETNERLEAVERKLGTVEDAIKKVTGGAAPKQ